VLGHFDSPKRRKNQRLPYFFGCSKIGYFLSPWSCLVTWECQVSNWHVVVNKSSSYSWISFEWSIILCWFWYWSLMKKHKLCVCRPMNIQISFIWTFVIFYNCLTFGCKSFTSFSQMYILGAVLLTHIVSNHNNYLILYILNCTKKNSQIDLFLYNVIFNIFAYISKNFKINLMNEKYTKNTFASYQPKLNHELNTQTRLMWNLLNDPLPRPGSNNEPKKWRFKLHWYL
jgi:hypothetical protein